VSDGWENVLNITTGAILFIALILQNVVLSHRGKGGFKQMIPKWLNFKGKIN
jgi:hypothetical protein